MPEIVVKLGNQVMDKHAMHQECIRIGRSRDNDIVIDHLSVSRHHAEIRFDHGHWLIADLESANGTYVNGQRVTTVPLYHADTITVGKLHLHFFDTPIEQDEQQIHDYADERTMVLGTMAPPRACLTVVRGRQRGKEFMVQGERATIGRASDCTIRLNDWRVSKYHAQVIRRDETFHIEDLGSWGAIQVNSTPVKESVLQDGDSVQVGGTRLSFRCLPPEIGAKPTIEQGRGLQERPPADDQADYKLAVAAAVDMANSPHDVSTHDESALINSYDENTNPTTEAEAPEDSSEETANDELVLDTELDSAEDDEAQFDKLEMPEEDELEQGDLIAEDGAEALEAMGEEDDSAGPAIEETPASSANGNGTDDERTFEDLDLSDPNVALWVEAYRSGRPAMRRHAARELEKITGRHYDV